MHTDPKDMKWQAGTELRVRKQHTMEAAQKIMPLFYDVLWCWRQMLVALAVEVEPSHQYVTLRCHVTDGSRGTVWQNASYALSCQTPDIRVLPYGRHGTRWHLLMLTEHWWRPSSGCEHRERWTTCTTLSQQRHCHRSCGTVGRLCSYWLSRYWDGVIKCVSDL